MGAKRTGGRGTALIFLGLSLLAAAVATGVLFLVFSQLNAQVQLNQELNDNVTILVAMEELPPGQRILPEKVDLKEIPKDYVTDTVLTSIDQVDGRVPRERVLPGEPIREERLALIDAGVGLTALIPNGMRAQMIDIDGGQAVSGFINPGNFVDVLVTAAEPSGEEHTTTLLQAKRVLAVDDRLASKQTTSRRVAPSVTLALTPEEVQLVTHATLVGTITLTLRNDIDVTHQEVHGVTPKSFIGKKNLRVKVDQIPQLVQRPAEPEPAPSAEVSPEPEPTEVQVIQGQRRETEQFE